MTSTLSDARKPEKVDHKAGQAVVVLDPGLSFGTGQHPTTEFCLLELVRVRQRLGASTLSFLDIGTGSGILAIAAAKLGYAPVRAFDFDPEAVRAARTNAEANEVSSKVRVTRADLSKLPRHGARRPAVSRHGDSGLDHSQGEISSDIPGISQIPGMS